MIHKFKNRGVILEVKESDYLGGTLPYEVRNPSGDWTAFVPKGENQYSQSADTMACVSFSFLNCLETQIKFLTKQEIDFSDRFLAKMSGTTPQGNYLGVVADTFRHFGCVLESEWPAPANFTWDSYYAPIDATVAQDALKVLDLYNVSYEWVETTVESLQYHLKQAPIQLVIPGHAICGVYEQADIFKYFDTYEPYLKDHQNPPLFALKVILKLKNMNKFVKVNTDVWLVKDGKRSLVYNALAFTLISGDWASIETITQAQLDAIPDTGKVLAGLDQQ